MKIRVQSANYSERGIKLLASIVLLTAVVLQTSYASASVIASNAKINIAQAKANITGTVKDKKGETLPGVTIMIKGSKTGTVTDINGVFKLNLPNGNETIIATMIGFNTLEIPVNGRTSLNIVLEESNSTLEEVVVIGYGVMKKKDLTGAVSSVKGSDLTANPVSNPVEALQGRVAGLDIQRTSGNSGAAPSILLRGNRSMTADQTPLYIIDGIPGSITSLNPNDIETIDVLKDASSTAIYGSAGANGVIIVTTKKGTVGAVKIDVDSYYGVNGFAKYPKPLMGEAWVQYLKDQYYGKNGTETNDISNMGLSVGVIDAVNAGQFVDWVDETLQTGSQQNHHISLRGGTEKTQGFMSLGYIGEKGVYPNDETKALNARAGADVKFNDFFKAGIQTTVNWTNRDATNSRINKAYAIAPVGIPYDENGTINKNPIANDGTISPLANFVPGVFLNNSKNLYLTANPYVEVKPLKNLIIRSNFGATVVSNRNGVYQNENSYNYATENIPRKDAAYTTGLRYNYIWENVINYNFTIKDDHSFGLTGITSWTDNTAETSSIIGQGLTYDEFIYYNMKDAALISSATTSYTGSKKMSFAGRANYSYKGKYLLQGSVRWDGASQLVEKWAAFPAVSAGWRISEESFMEGTRSWLNNLKLRAGYGSSGTANINPYSSLTEVAASSTSLSLGGSAKLPIYVLTQNLGNTDLSWETSYNTNIGLDMSVLNNRIEVAVDWYDTKTKGVLWNRKLPFTNGGFDAKTPYIMTSNIAETANHGIEINLNTRNIIKRDFQWTSNLTFTKSKEKLVEIDLGGNVTAADLISEGLFIGNSIGTYYGYKKTGIWQTAEADEAAKYGAKPGDIKLQTVEKFDANGISDGGVHAYSADDRMILGHSNPDWTLGLQNSFVYKNFDLSIFVNARYGQMANASILGYYNAVTQPEFYDYWTPTNPTNDFPLPNDGTGINTQYKSALNYVDGSYLKIKNITLGYRLPESIGKKVGFSRCRFYATAYNPFIYAKSHLLKELDPESGGSDSFPLYKQIVFGVNLSF